VGVLFSLETIRITNIFNSRFLFFKNTFLISLHYNYETAMTSPGYEQYILLPNWNTTGLLEE
jgi:hypothetical protein